MHIPACGDHQQTETQTQQGGSLVRTVQEAKGAVTGGGEDDTSFASRIIDFGSPGPPQIKCDRKLPCESCIKRGEQASCRWEQPKVEPPP